MSVILKALARAQRECAPRHDPANDALKPASAAAAPQGSIPPFHGHAVKIMLIGSLIILLMAIAGALVSVGYVMGRLNGLEAGIRAASDRQTKPAAGSAGASGVAAGAAMPATDLPVMTPNPASAALSPAATKPVTDDLPPPVPMGQMTPTGQAQAGAGQQTARTPAAQPRTLTLTSITYSGANKQAVISGATVHEGETTDDFTVLKITASTVTIQRRDGKILTLSLSRS
ncbi:MAG: hypothetical protein WCK47_13775 [bacterium]|nr:hypothetical protein [Candidatus Sumerlaeota bacterium]